MKVKIDHQYTKGFAALALLLALFVIVKANVSVALFLLTANFI